MAEDYHGNVDGKIFTEWFTNLCWQLRCRGINALLILDNAPYHKVKDTDPIREVYFHGHTLSTARKPELEDYLKHISVAYPPKATVPELREIAKQYYGAPPIRIRTIAEFYGHEVLFTPPYWPEFQPIEMIWGVIKNFILTNRHDHSITELQQLLQLAYLNVTPDLWAKTIASVHRFEDQFNWQDLQPKFSTHYFDEVEEPEEAIEFYDSSSESDEEVMEITD